MNSVTRELAARPAAPPRRGGLHIGRIFGIAIHLDWSLLIIFFLITATLAAGLFPAWHPDWTPAHSWATAVAAALLFFASVLAHELSHALVGRRYGMTVRRITLFVFGGVAELENEPSSWRGELWMAIVGPLTSLVLGCVFLFSAGALTGSVQLNPADPGQLLSQLSTGPTLLLWLGQINIILALFNLVPAFPLDGGRVLRALLWGATGNLRKATRWASAAGQMFAWVLIAMGMAMLLGVRVPVFGAGPIGGLWLAFIGWFLNNAALMSYRQLLVREALEDLPVASLMQTDFITVSPDLSVFELIDQYLLRSGQRAFPVTEGGRLLGIVTLEDVRRLDASERPTTAVTRVMTPLEKLTTVGPQDEAMEVLSMLGRSEVNQLPVVENGVLLGLLRREDVVKWLALYGDSRERPSLRHRFAAGH